MTNQRSTLRSETGNEDCFEKDFTYSRLQEGVVEATAGVKPGVRSNIAKGMWFKFLGRKGQRLGQRAYKRSKNIKKRKISMVDA